MFNLNIRLPVRRCSTPTKCKLSLMQGGRGRAAPPQAGPIITGPWVIWSPAQLRQGPRCVAHPPAGSPKGRIGRLSAPGVI
eukprot:scaffold2455_cov387-Prasinococcus_capsulatus_cf.AAC.12